MVSSECWPANLEMSIGIDAKSRALKRLVAQINESNLQFYTAVEGISYAAGDWVA